MFFFSVILKTHLKKVIDCQKRNFGRFRQLITFLCILINTDLNNICASIVFNAKTKKNNNTKMF